MMSQSNQWKHNVKDVMRITLVGVEPGLQVLIKGYLRILLRIDFDLEWVSPRNPKVNLFIVNEAFSQADSVRKLLDDSNAPALYVTKNELKQNVIENNTLYMDLKEISTLERWLNENVPLIYQTYNSDNNTSHRNDTAKKFTDQGSQTIKSSRGKTQSSNLQPSNLRSSNLQSSGAQPNRAFSQTSEKLFSDRDNQSVNTIKKPSQTNTNQAVNQPKPQLVPALLAKNSQSSNNIQATPKNDNKLTANAITLINTFNDLDGHKYYEVINAGRCIAIVKPQQRLIWPKGDTFFPDFSLGWQLKEVVAPNIQVKHAMNLNTWIWICTLHKHSAISEILPVDAKLSLKTWPKPKNNSDKSDYLRILAMTELKPLSVSDIVKKTNIDKDKVHRCLAGLYMAGFMDTGLLTLDVFVKQRVREITPANQKIKVDKAVPLDVETKDGKIIATKEELEKMINEQVQKKLEENYVDTSNTIVKDKSFPGLLSRIRSTLGF